jgi:hypothetical protein
MYKEGSYKWPLAFVISLLVAFGLCYPTESLFILKFLWDLIVINVTPLLQKLHLMKST